MLFRVQTWYKRRLLVSITIIIEHCRANALLLSRRDKLNKLINVVIDALPAMGRHFSTKTVSLPLFIVVVLYYIVLCLFVTAGYADFRHSNVNNDGNNLLVKSLKQRRSDIYHNNGAVSPEHKRSASDLVHHKQHEVEEDSKKFAVGGKMYNAGDIDKIKRSIMEGLGLSEIPDASKMNVSQEEYIRVFGIYLRNEDERRTRRRIQKYASNPELARTEPYTIQRFFTFSHENNQPYQRHRRHNNHQQILNFPTNISSDNSDNSFPVDVEHATLRLLVPGIEPNLLRQRKHNQVTMKIYHHNEKNRSRLLVQKRSVHLAETHPKWTDFDVTSALEDSLQNGENLRLELKCDECEKLKLNHLDHIRSAAVNTLVNYEVGDDDENNSDVRTKRSLSYHERRRLKKRQKTQCFNNSRECCRYNMQITFKELKEFEFIIQPRTFDAGYCKGGCPFRHIPANTHAFIQSLMWRNNRTISKPCCAPSRLNALQVVHYDMKQPNKLKIAVWQDMEVDECACT